ncbi:hypothetical protein D3C87_102080 [compost metagenome]
MTREQAHFYILDLIQKHLLERRQKNPRYSLRALAKKLDVSPATLSEALRNKRVMTKSTVTKIVGLIAANDPNASACLSYFNDHYPSYKDGENKIPQQRIPEDELLLFKNWYHLAMVTFFDTRHYDGSLESIAGYFGISILEAKDAVDRLLRLGVVEHRDGRLQNTAQFYITDRTRLSESIHLSKNQALKNAIHALNGRTAKDHSDFSMMFSVFDESLLPEAIEYFDKMKKGFVKKFRGKGNKTAVYQLSIQFFPCEKLGPAPELIEDKKEGTAPVANGNIMFAGDREKSLVSILDAPADL